MRWLDLIRFALRGLRRQTVRTLLTTAGVAVGACTLAFSLALGMGLRAFVDNEFQSRPGFWEVSVSPGLSPAATSDKEIPPTAIQVQGTYSPERTARLRDQLVKRYWMNHAPKTPVALTRESLAKLAALPGVADVVAARWGQGPCYWNSKSAFANVVTGRCDQPMFLERLVAGRAPSRDADECAVAEMLLYDLGARDDAAMQAALGSKIEVELGGRRDELAMIAERINLTAEEKKALQEMLAKAPKGPTGEPAKGTFTIVGVARGPKESEEAARGSYFLRWSTFFAGGPESEAMFRKLPHLKDGHYDQAEVKVTPGSNLPETVKAIEALGFETQSAAEWYRNAKREVTLIGAGLNVFAILALVVASFGMTNTLVTSVVERTREIGILKAVGATRGQIRGLFLVEGTLIGTVGGLLGLLSARLLAGPADEYVKQQVRTMMRGEEMLSESVFDFAWWLNAATPLFTALITTLAALYPAHRAARITPVEALRHG